MGLTKFSLPKYNQGYGILVNIKRENLEDKLEDKIDIGINQFEIRNTYVK